MCEGSVQGADLEKSESLPLVDETFLSPGPWIEDARLWDDLEPNLPFWIISTKAGTKDTAIWTNIKSVFVSCCLVHVGGLFNTLACWWKDSVGIDLPIPTENVFC